MKKYEFFYHPQIPAVEPDIEIIEFDDNVTEDEIKKVFTEWIFEKLDTGYRILE